MRILFTNFALDQRAGTEMYIHDVALECRRRGHEVMVYAPVLGAVAERLRQATIPVARDVRDLGDAPDIIHGHHHLELLTALTRFPDTPAVSFCHGWRPWEEMPLTAAQVRRFVCVDTATRDRMAFEHGVPLDRIRIQPNFVDIAAFPPRSPLPAKAQRVLLYSNYATETTPYYQAARQACQAAGLTLDAVGAHFGNATQNPAELLARYDIVLAQGRSALEALAVGARVIICSSRRFGETVQRKNVEELRTLNFGIRAQNLPVSADILHAHLLQYNPADAAATSAYIRQQAGLTQAVDNLLAIYQEAQSDFRSAQPAAENRTALPDYLRLLSLRLRRDADLEQRRFILEEEKLELENRLAGLLRQVEALENSTAWRLRQRLLRLPGLAAMQRHLERWLKERARRRRAG